MSSVQMVSYVLYVCHCNIWNDMMCELMKRGEG
jgi:hypothetical protein